MTVTGAQLVALAMRDVGVRYVYGAKVPAGIDYLTSRAYPRDCSGEVAYVTAALGVPLLGSSGQQYAACAAAHLTIPVAQAIITPGALLFIQPDIHVAISQGNAAHQTIEAHDTADGVGVWPATGRFNAAALIPGVDYTQEIDMALTATDLQDIVNAVVPALMKAYDAAATSTLAGTPVVGTAFIDGVAKRAGAMLLADQQAQEKTT